GDVVEVPQADIRCYAAIYLFLASFDDHRQQRRRHSRVPRQLQLWSRSLLTWRLVALPQPRRYFFPHDQPFDRHIATSKLLCGPSVETLRNQSPDTSMFAASSARCNIQSCLSACSWPCHFGGG